MKVQNDTLTLTINNAKYSHQIISSQPMHSNQVHAKNLPIKKADSDIGTENIQMNMEQGAYFTIISPMIGTFYRSPAPNEAPFIDVNDTVKTNQTVCIIEAMKLMNEIESEVNGDIVEILVHDGDIVDCGQALMKVKQK